MCVLELSEIQDHVHVNDGQLKKSRSKLEALKKKVIFFAFSNNRPFFF